MPDEIKQEDVPNPQTRTVEELLAELKGKMDEEKTEDLYNRLEPYFKETIDGVLGAVENRIEALEEVEPPEPEIVVGPQGVQGVQGPKGDRGLTGARGPQGFPGIPGEKGVKGDVGDKGDDGASVELKEVVDELRPEILRLIPKGGGGNMNRNISIGGNSSVLSRYADINLKAGANVTLTYVNNNTTKNVDITIAATGGSGSGIVRSVNNINTNTVAGSTSTTDYVYLCTGPLTLTLPDATGNTNLYTVKNVGGGTTTINTTSSQTIDGGLTATLSTLYIEITLVSDGSNWNVGV